MSIQVSLNGLSFCILNSDDSSYTFVDSVDFGKKINPETLLEHLKASFKENEELNASFQSVSVIYDNELYVIVPRALFNADQLADYIKFNSRILQTDFLAYDALKNLDANCIFVPYVNINNYLLDLFGNFEYRHSSTVLIDSLMAEGKNSQNDMVFAVIQENHFDLVVIENSGLKFHNRFDYSTTEDFIYYLLFTAEQLELNPEEFELILKGTIDENDDLFKMAYKYIRHSKVNISNGEDSRNYLLINSFK